MNEEWHSHSCRARERVVPLAFNFPLPFRPGASCTQKITSIMNGGGGNGGLAALDIMGGPERRDIRHDGRRTEDDEAEVIVAILDFGWGEKVRQEVQEA